MSYNGIEVVHVVAMDQNNCIGKQGKLPWHIREDLQRFKDMTTGGIVVMGRKTYESIGNPLVDRVNIVVSRDDNFQPYGVAIAGSIEAALIYATHKAKELNKDQIFIIGGGEIYAQTMDIVDRIELTRVKTFVKDGDAFYPEIDCINEGGIFALIGEGDVVSSGFYYSFVTYARKLNTTVGKDEGEWCVLDQRGEVVYHGSSHNDAKLWFKRNAGLGHRYTLEELPAVERQKIIDQALAKQVTDAMSDDVATFAVGDLVVIKSSWKPNNKRLYEIEDIKGTSVRVSAYIPHLHKFSREILGFCIGIENIRTATLAEKASGYRIDETEEELAAEAVANRDLSKKVVDAMSDTLFQKQYDQVEVPKHPDFDKIVKKWVERKEKNTPFNLYMPEQPIGIKNDSAKPRYSLIPEHTLAAIVDVLEHGATKYAVGNWKHVDNANERYYNATMRHIQAWWEGEPIDPETGLSHLAHAATNIMFLLSVEQQDKLMGH